MLDCSKALIVWFVSDIAKIATITCIFECILWNGTKSKCICVLENETQKDKIQTQRKKTQDKNKKKLVDIY